MTARRFCYTGAQYYFRKGGFYVSEKRTGHQAVDGRLRGVCRLGLAGLRARRYFDSVCGCGGAGVCVGPLVEWLQKKGLNRASASMSVMVFSLILLLALLLIIVPMLVGQFNNLASRLPQLIGFMQNTLLPWLKNTIGGYVEIDQASIIAWFQAHTGELSNALKAWFPVLMKQGGNIVSSIGNLLLPPLLLYYFLLDWQRWSCGIAKPAPEAFCRCLYAHYG